MILFTLDTVYFTCVTTCSVHLGLHLVNSIGWFERCSAVPPWIQIATDKCKLGIRNSVADDASVAVNEAVNYSTSAHFTEGFIMNVADFWKNLRWPDPLMSSCYAVMVVNGIAECSSHYVSLISKNLSYSIDDLFDKHGQYRVNEKVRYQHYACQGSI